MFIADDSGGISSLFTALGINAEALILNILAFLLVAWVLGKFVYPQLITALDAKKDELEAASRLQRDAASRLEKAEHQADKILHEARTGADEVMAGAHEAAAKLASDARTKAQAQSERLVSEAREQLEADVRQARETLRSDAARLVAEAAGTVIGHKLDSQSDGDLIKRSLEGRS